MSRSKKNFSVEAPVGTSDAVPEDQKYLRFVFKKTQGLLEDYGFERIDVPLFESSDLYAKAAGSNSEEFKKSLVTFKEQSGTEYSFRHNHVFGVARAYATNDLRSRVHPIKLFFSGPVIRQTESGLHQHHEMGVVTIGDGSEVIDSEFIFLGYKILHALGLDNYQVRINTLGDANCRPAYTRALKDFYKTRMKKICADCRNNLKTSVLKLLECREDGCRETAKDTPQAVDFLDESCRFHFKKVLEFLDSAKIPYLLDPTLVKSDDYATRTVFEFWSDDNLSTSGPILTGGRADKLIESVGGGKMPAAAWSLDVDLAVDELKNKSANVPEIGTKPKVFLVQLGDAAKRKSLLLFEDIRKAGLEIKYSLSRDSLKAQLRIASRLGVKFTLLFGQKEAIESTVICREMETGIQETIPLEKIIDELKKRLKKA